MCGMHLFGFSVYGVLAFGEGVEGITSVLKSSVYIYSVCAHVCGATTSSPERKESGHEHVAPTVQSSNMLHVIPTVFSFYIEDI